MEEVSNNDMSSDIAHSINAEDVSVPAANTSTKSFTFALLLELLSKCSSTNRSRTASSAFATLSNLSSKQFTLSIQPSHGTKSPMANSPNSSTNFFNNTPKLALSSLAYFLPKAALQSTSFVSVTKVSLKFTTDGIDFTIFSTIEAVSSSLMDRKDRTLVRRQRAWACCLTAAALNHHISATRSEGNGEELSRVGEGCLGLEASVERVVGFFGCLC
ncbi:hypothetical protein Cgig2_033971 [Carnegiea gigantea]|uniref:Uncharacterized protein n=1 Tax=Carnegiea gigantea TaxID=171969 RepID=A0A9Q1GKF4_9CARY|nr:hypothetical protein Cgig2_033971 [Carnegiea gigantea]